VTRRTGWILAKSQRAIGVYKLSNVFVSYHWYISAKSVFKDRAGPRPIGQESSIGNEICRGVSIGREEVVMVSDESAAFVCGKPYDLWNPISKVASFEARKYAWRYDLFRD
jgi:hypothetical protein